MVRCALRCSILSLLAVACVSDADRAPQSFLGASMEAVDAIRSRYGSRLIGPARLAGRGERSRSAQWGPDAPSPDQEPHG